MTDESSQLDPVARPDLANLVSDQGLGALGGFDMGALLQQAQQMQAQLQQAQRSLAEATTDGSAGNGSVHVTVSGVGELKAVLIAPDTFDPHDPSSLEDLGDLIVAAYRDAKTHADLLTSDALGPLSHMLGG